MAVCQIVENPELTQDQWEELSAHLRTTGPVPPEGLRLMLAGPADPGWRVITVWDSEETRDRFFTERLTAAYEAAGLSFANVKRTLFDVHTLTAGDLTGTPQPA